jgi:hypothetical protein
MSRSLFSLRAFGLAATFALSAVSLVSGCADLGPPESGLHARQEKPATDSPLCRSISDALYGKEASIYEVNGSGGLLACVVNNEVVCVDDAQGVIDSGVVPVVPPPTEQKPVIQGIELDGTPLPADIIKGMASGSNPNPSANTVAPPLH